MPKYNVIVSYKFVASTEIEAPSVDDAFGKVIELGILNPDFDESEHYSEGSLQIENIYEVTDED